MIAGPVNAGKSSLFNRLIGEAHAIVTEIPGTTRDVLRETVVMEGIPFVLHDTAGLRDVTTDRVEAIGVDRAVDAAQNADVVVFVLDGSLDDPLAGSDARAAFAQLDAARALVVWNKTDRSARAKPPVRRPDLELVRASALTGDGVDEIRRSLLRLVGSEALARSARDRSILNARLATLFADARGRLDALGQSVEAREPLEILAVQARDVLGLYEEATGRRYHDGLLEAIFSRFCIGK